MTRMAGTGSARVFSLLATIVRVVCSVIAALIVIHAVFVLFEANPDNLLVHFTAGWRDTFGWFTKNLFAPSDPKIAEAINDGLASNSTNTAWITISAAMTEQTTRTIVARSEKTRAEPVLAMRRMIPQAARLRDRSRQAARDAECPVRNARPASRRRRLICAQGGRVPPSSPRPACRTR